MEDGKICFKCKNFKNYSLFYADKHETNKYSTYCKECQKENNKKNRLKYQHQIKPASISLIKKNKIVDIGIFYIPDIVIVGVGKLQTYQHKCLKCESHFFFNDINKNFDNLFCGYCVPDKSLLKESNVSTVNYIGNVVGWKQITSNDTIQKRTSRNYKKVYQRDCYTCQYCGFNLANATEFVPLHIDHIKPVCAGGNNSMENMCVSCQTCNLIANGKWFTDFQDKKEHILTVKNHREKNARCY